METIRTEIELWNSFDDPVVEKFFSVMGSRVVRVDECWGEGDCDTSYEFPNSGDAGIGIIGDNSIGAVVGAYMNDDDLIAIANWGDDGDTEFHISSENKGLVMIKLETLWSYYS